MMTKGFRQKAAPSKKQMETELKNLTMSVRISQMMLKQLMENMQNMNKDLQSALNQVYELQYKQLAVQEALKLESSVLDEIANKHRLEDFVEAAANADVKESLEPADVAGIDSTVVITSSATDASGKDKGIFRSRIKLSESGSQPLIDGLQGKKVGDKVIVKLNDLDHEVEILAIRNPKQDVQQLEATH